MGVIKKSLIAIVGIATLVSCDRKGCMDPLANNYSDKAKKDCCCEYDAVPPPSYTVPTTYSFTDNSGNSTVSYGGQQQRLEMLSEITTYLKTTNTAGNSIDAAVLKDMYANSSYTWVDTDALGMTGSSKQLKSKTAKGDGGIIAEFEAWMNDAAAASPNVGGGYLQNADGIEWTQLIEKGLMSACFISQMTDNYLADIASDDNLTASDPDNGKYYTSMEHHWDEAYGYFTDATDYPTSGTNRFWGKYANNTLESVIGSATNISTAFRTGRAAIAADRINPDQGFTADAIAQSEIITIEAQRMVAGMAIHYLNSTKQKVADGESQNKVCHYLSEAWAFIYGIQFAHDPVMSRTEVMGILVDGMPGGYPAINDDFYGFAQSTMSVNAVIDVIANAHGFTQTERENL
jgi:hypothetical protein